MTPLYKPLNVAVLHIASRLFPTGFDVTMDEGEAPDTLERLTDHIARTGRMLVWGGASDHTIFDDAGVNHAFRAWHDLHHWKGQFAFDPVGERLTASCQIADILKLYGRDPRALHMCRLIDAEVCGQVAYALAHDGAFPTDQAAFIRSYLENPAHAVTSSF